MKKRIVSLLLAVIMVATLFTACKQEPSGDGEMPTLNVLAAHGYTYEGADNQIWAKVAEKVGAKIHFVAADTDKFNAMLASGEGWDIIVMPGGNMKTTAETGAILAMDEYLAEHGKNITANLADHIAWSRKNLGDGEKLYWIQNFLNPNGAKVGEYNVSRGLIRWDLYAGMGYPEVKNGMDQAQLLIDMVEKYPTNAAGETAYAVCIPSDAAWNFLRYPFADWNGVNFWSGSELAGYKWSDMSYVNFLDSEEGAYWDAIEYYRELYKAGVMDPDSFAITEAEHNAKVTAGRLYSVFASWEVADMAEGTGFLAIPMTEVPTAHMYKIPKDKGTSTPDRGYGINAKTEHAELCVKFLDFLASEEGANLIVNGIEGVHYTVENGVRVQTQAAKDLWANAEDAYKVGLVHGESGNFSIYDTNTVWSDGLPLNLNNNPADWSSKVTAGSVEADFCDKYDVVYPGEYYAKVIKDNKLPCFADLTAEQKASFQSAPDNIKTIEAALKLEAETWAAKLIQASDADYANLVAEALAAFEAAGMADMDAWYNAQ